MIAALYILIALIVVGGVLRLLHREDNEATSKQADDKATVETTDEECCGMHVTCERDSLLSSVSKEIDYFDDEELDRYAGVPAASYNLEQTEEFREVLLTLLPDDIAPWARSLQLRGIELPVAVREELLLIVSENRQKRGVAP